MCYSFKFKACKVHDLVLHFLSFLFRRYPHACLLFSVFMGWSPVVHLVHMGAELCELRSTADSTHTYQNTPKLCAAKCKCRNLLFCREHVTSLIITDLIKLSTTAHLKRVTLFDWWRVAESVSALNCSTGGGGKCCRAESLYEAAGCIAMYGSGCLFKPAFSS